MKRIFYFLIILFLPVCLFAQVARIGSFTHTIRWLTEFSFPNYFQDPQVFNSICNDIREDLILQCQVQDVSFPEKADYRVITGFGKPKEEWSKVQISSDYTVDIFSFLTRQTIGLAVDWSVKIVIRKDGKVLSEKAVTHEIENANAAVYMIPQRWWPPHEFREVFQTLTREAMGIPGEYSGIIKVGNIEAKEKEVVLWFPQVTRYKLLTRGALEGNENFATQLVDMEDTITQFELRHKWENLAPHFSLKPLLAGLFTELTGWGTSYTIKVKETRRAAMKFPTGQNLLMQMNWIDAYTYTTTYEEVEMNSVVPMIGQFFVDTQLVGKFIYEQMSTIDAKPIAYPYRPAVVHRVVGTLKGHEFMVEYNEFLGIAEITMDDQFLAAMIFQNYNPENLNAFMNKRLSRNKKTITGSTGLGSPDLEDSTKQEWYSFFIKQDASGEEQVHSMEFLVCLFFSIGIQ